MLRLLVRKLSVLAVLAVLTSRSSLAQSAVRKPSVSGFAGVAVSSDEAALVGIEFHPLELGRVEPSLGGTYWWRLSGCDAIAGVPCDENAFGADLGAAIRLTPAHPAWRLLLSLHLGGLFYGSLDRGIWDPSAGVAFRWLGEGRVGGQAEIRYHALTASESSSAYQPSTSDYVAIQAGILIRL